MQTTLFNQKPKRRTKRRMTIAEICDMNRKHWQDLQIYLPHIIPLINANIRQQS